MLIKLLHIVNIWALLISTVGLPTFGHYCQGNLKSLSFFGDFTTNCKKGQGSCAKPKPAKKSLRTCCQRSTTCHKTSPKGSQAPSIQTKKCCTDKSSYKLSQLTAANDMEGEWAPFVLEQFFIELPNWQRLLDLVKLPLQDVSKWYSHKIPPERNLYRLHETWLC